MQYNPPAAPAVRDVLERVVRSDTFARSDRARKLLHCLVEREQAVEASSAHASWWDFSLFLACFMMDDMAGAAEATDALASTKRANYLAARLIAA